jgi:hypothetical protein
VTRPRFATHGAKAEQGVAYEIEFRYGASADVMTIHELRIECDGRVAQIDHLIIHRFLDVWVCESKFFSGGVEINESGEWSTNWGGRPHGIPSPIAQNYRHCTVVADVFAKGLVRVPKRLGFPLELKMKPVVLLSNSARIRRPTGWAASRVEGLESVIKSDQLYATINRSIAGKDIGDVVASFVGPETVQRLAKELAALHVRARFDWAAKFGLRPKSTNATRAIPLGPPSSRRGGETRGSNRDTVKDRLRILRGDCLRGRSQLLPGETRRSSEAASSVRVARRGQDSRAPSDNAPED